MISRSSAEAAVVLAVTLAARQLEEMGLIQSDEQALASAIGGVTKAMEQMTTDTRVQVARADIKGNLMLALEVYKAVHGSFPTTEQGLQALLRFHQSFSSSTRQRCTA